jgi:hypothetical protein
MLLRFPRVRTAQGNIMPIVRRELLRLGESANPAGVVESVRLIESRDIAAECAALAARANAMQREGLTAWHERRDRPPVGGTPRADPAPNRRMPPSTKSSRVRGEGKVG